MFSMFLLDFYLLTVPYDVTSIVPFDIASIVAHDFNSDFPHDCTSVLPNDFYLCLSLTILPLSFPL